MKKQVLMGFLSLLMLAVCTVGNAQTPVKRYGQLQVRGSQYTLSLSSLRSPHIEIRYSQLSTKAVDNVWITRGKQICYPQYMDSRKWGRGYPHVYHGYSHTFSTVFH